MGYIINVKNCKRAVISANSDSAYTLGTITSMPDLRQIDLTFKTASGDLYGDGKLVSSLARLTGATLKIDIDKLTTADKAFFGGHTLSQKGVLQVQADDTPPQCAIYVEAEHDDGGYEATWFLVCRAQPVGMTAQQQETNINFSTYSITFDCIPRKKDSAVVHQADTDDANFTTANQTAFLAGPDI